MSVWREEGGFIGERRFRESRSHAFSGESFFFFFNSTSKAIIVSLEGRCPPWTIFLSIVIDDLSSSRENWKSLVVLI